MQYSSDRGALYRDLMNLDIMAVSPLVDIALDASDSSAVVGVSREYQW